MTAIDCMEQCEALEKRIQQLQEKIDYLRASACSTTIQLKEDKIQTSGSKDKIADIVAEIWELEQRIDRLIDRKYDLKQILEREINSLSGKKQRNIMIKRYVYEMPIMNIAEQDGVTISTVKSSISHAKKKFKHKI